MNRLSVFFIALSFALTSSIRAAVPTPAQLLPPDTLAVVSVPDWEKAAELFSQSAAGQLWRDPALRAFKEKLIKRMELELITPLERELSTKFSDYTGLLNGQVTFACTRNGWDGKSENIPGLLLLIDSKGKSDQLAKHLADLRKKWVDSGKQLKSDTIRGVEFTTLMVRKTDLQQTLEKAFPAKAADADDDADADKDPAADDAKFEVTFGQADSLLLIGNSTKEIEKVLIRKAGTGNPTLAEQAAFEANQSALFRDAYFFGWVDFKALYEVFERQAMEAAKRMEAEEPANGAPPGFAPKPDRILAATGLSGLKTIAMKASGNAEGSLVEFFLSIPEANRQGLFKILAPEAKDASPPPFIPAEAVKYTRWRLDGQKAWATLESMVNAISPEMMAIVQMGLATVGKDKDPNFDLKKALIGNLGDDFIAFEKNPRSATLDAFSAPPALFLVGSPNAEKLVQGLKAATGIMPLPPGEGGLRERDFLGRKIYTVSFSPPAAEGAAGRSSLSFAASGGYVALSMDVTMIEEFLRSAEAAGKPLRETVGLPEAAQKVGGMNTGFFGYENQSETMRVTLELLKKNGDSFEKLLSLPGSGDDQDDEPGGNLSDWLDFKLLPAFDEISKYFHFVIYNGTASSQGLSWKVFSPTPPRLR